MSEDDVKRGNVKLCVFDCFPYEEYKRICDAIVAMGYEALVVSNGNVVFQKKVE